MPVVYRIICLIIGYLFGIIQTAFIIGKINHVDIRQYGSGNSGTTNAMRTLGKKAGSITLVGDVSKAILATLLVRIIFQSTDYTFVLVMYAGLGVILGHNFPFYMNFKGGKGIAATAGLLISCLDIRVMLVCLALFVVTLGISKYVSLGSLVMITGFTAQIIIFGEMGWFLEICDFNKKYNIIIYIITIIIAIFAFIRHKDNIKRIADGTERKIGDKKEAINE